MQLTKATFCLWIGCSILAAFLTYDVAYQLGASNALDVVAQDIGHESDLNGPESFTINFPTVIADAVAFAGAILAVAGLLTSWRLNKQPLLSLPYFAALFFLVSPMTALLIQ